MPRRTDKDILDSRKKIKGIEAPLRDQIVTKLVNRLKREKYAHEAVEAWMDAQNNRANWLARQQEYLANWDEFLMADSNGGSFEGSSQLHLPTAYTIVKTYHARFLQQLLGVDPPFTANPRRADSAEAAQMIEDLMSYALKEWANNWEGIFSFADEYVWRWITTGAGLGKVRWEVKFERYIDVIGLPVEGPAEFAIDEDGNEVAIPTIGVQEEEVEIDRNTFSGPCWDLIEPEDFALIGGRGDPDKAERVFHRQYLTASELWGLVDRKIFDEKVVTKIIKAGPDKKQGAIGNDIKHQRQITRGYSQLEIESEKDKYEVLEVYEARDVTSSGINSEIVTWVHPATHSILRATYLRRINKAGKRPFSKSNFFELNGEEFSKGLVEVLHPITTEIDAMHNLRVDFGLISTMPMFFYRAQNSLEAEEIQFRPGAGIPVEDPQRDVFFPQIGNREIFGANQEASLFQQVERLTGISSLSLGVISSEQGVTRTATGARALVAEQNANLDVHVRRLNKGWRKLLELTLHQLQQKTPPGFEFMVTGSDGKKYFQRVEDQAQLQGDFDIDLSPNSENSNKAISQQKAQLVLQMALNPLLIQTGIVNGGNIYEAVKNYYSSLGVKDFSRFINKPQGQTFTLTPEEELNRVLRLIPVEVDPAMDHEGYIAVWEEMKQNEEALSNFNEDALRAAEAQSIAHQQMMQAMQQAQAQAAAQQQAQNNALNASGGAAQAAGVPPASQPEQ